MTTEQATELEKLLDAFKALAVSVPLNALTAIWDGYVLTVLWGWFIVPQFGLPALHLVPAMGVSLVVSQLTHQSIPPDVMTNGRTPWELLWRWTTMLTVKPLIYLAIGWVIHMFLH